MQHLSIRTILVLVFALLLGSLAGCGGTTTSEGDSTSAPAVTDVSTPAAELPPAPADASGLSAWFAEAYPEAIWASRIVDIQYVAGEVPGSGGFSNAVVITTDLDFQTEQAIAQEIVAALNETGLTWAEQYVLWFADGSNELAGELVGMTP